MMTFHLGNHDLISHVLGAIAWLAIGAAIGAVYFLTLRWNVSMFEVSRPLVLAFALQFVRFAVIAVVLAVIARQFGALPLLIATAGILAARPAVLRLGAQS